MRELLELRIPEENADRFLPSGLGTPLGMVRKVVLDTSEPMYAEVGRLQQEFRAQGRWFFHGWTFHRHYTAAEIARAELFYIYPGRTFEPAGEECGTSYDDAEGCPECGAGAPQIGPLFLDDRHIPKGPDFAVTIAGETVVSSRAVETLRESGLSGVEFGPIRSSRNRELSPDRSQLKVVGPFLQLDPKTQVGDGPFDQSSYGRCSRGDLAGLNLVSEVSVRRESLTGANVAATLQMVGTRRGLLRPHRLVLLSPRAMRSIQDAHLKGLVIEVAHLQ